MKSTTLYDLAILGAGPAGYVAAERAGHAGMKVILFDKKELGGVCLNEGCIPTKTLLYAAKLYENAKHSDPYGIVCNEVHFDFKKMMDRKEKIIRKLAGGIDMKMKANKIEVVKGQATFQEKTKDGILIAAEGTVYESKNVLICTGSEAAIPPIKGLNKEECLTNREILQLTEVPASLIIIGGGVIGIEFAHFFQTLGTQVTVLEMRDEILPEMDGEISKMLRDELTKKGVVFQLEANVSEIQGKKVLFEKKGKQSYVEAEKILVSTGRTLNVEGLGLEKIGVQFSAKGIAIDKKCRTNLPNVFAAGDVTGVSLLAHTASRAAEVAVNTMLGKSDTMRYHAIPAVIYTNPEVASVGFTEEKAAQQNLKVKVFKMPMVYAGRFVAENEGKNGLIKVVVGSTYHEILGVHMIGNPSGEIIYGAAMAIEMQLRVHDIKELVFPHPTVSEIFKEAIFMAE